MTFYAINGSPRKKGNTVRVLDTVLDGVRRALPEADAELVHLAEYRFTGCRSCFACKRKGGASYGRCAVRDDLTPLLEKLADADGIILGSPVYFMGASAAFRALQERLLFPFVVYDAAYSSLAPKRMPTAFVYTMNLTEADMAALKLPALLALQEASVGRVFSPPEVLHVCDTVQFDDYSLYAAERFSEEEKKRHRHEHFPEDLQRAFELGESMAARAAGRA